MPKRLIREVDNTGSVQLSSVSNTVYIPGPADAAVEPVTFKDASTFKSLIGSTYSDGLSARLALRLLKLGMYVVYEGLKEENGSVSINWSKMLNKTKYDVRFLTTGQYSNPSNDMISCAANRGDCVALLDHPEDLKDATDLYGLWENYKSNTDYIGAQRYKKEGVNYVEDSNGDYVKLLAKDIDNSYAAKVRRYFEAFSGTSTVNSDADSFASAFTPWFETNNEDFKYTTTDSEGKEITAYYDIPASFGYLLAYARSVKNNPSWLPVAGSFRGSIPELTAVAHEYTDADVEMLQARAVSGAVELGYDDTPFLDGDNVGKAINPIAWVGESFGYLIWGNRTFRTNDANYRTIATSFLNVRNMLSELKKQMNIASIKYTFEPNNDVLWANWQAQVTPLLNKMESGSGILGYQLLRERTSAKARLKARCVIVPVEGVEDFELKVQLEDSLDIVE